MSAEMQRIFGRPAEKMLSYKDFIEAVHPSDRERVERSWQGALEGRPYDIEYRISAGEIDRVVRAQARLKFSAEGKPLGGVGIVQDITGERNAEYSYSHTASRAKRRGALPPGAIAREHESDGKLPCHVKERSDRFDYRR